MSWPITSKIEAVKDDSIQNKESSAVGNKLFPSKPKIGCSLGYSKRIATNHYPLEIFLYTNTM